MTKNSETQLALAKNGEKREKIMFSLNDLKELMSILTKTDPNDEMDDDQVTKISDMSILFRNIQDLVISTKIVKQLFLVLFYP